MIGAFTTLAEKMKIFQAIGESFKGWGMIFKTVADAVGQDTKTQKGDKMFSGR